MKIFFSMQKGIPNLVLNFYSAYQGINKISEMNTRLIRASRNNKKRSHTQLDSRKQVIAFQDRVMTINIKEAQHPLK